MARHDLLRVDQEEGRDWTASGLNEMVRIVRYQQGGVFGAHIDTHFERSWQERSFWTLNIYLNSVAEEQRGATVFLGEVVGDQVEVAVQPEEGAGLLFFQPGTRHEGRVLRGGKKWLLRTDVMFKAD